MTISIGEAIRQNVPPTDPLVAESSIVRNWSLLSIYNTLGDVQSWIFGFRSFSDVWPAFTLLAVITVVSFLVLHRRVAAPLRA